MRTSFVIASVIGASALLLTSCAGGGDAEKKDRVTINSLLGAPDYANVDWQDQERKVQEAIAVCMREQGWEYIPVEQPDGFYNYNEEDELELYKKQGFGIVYYTLNRGNESSGDDPYADWVDPNQKYVESLSESEMTAYYESLHGTQEEQEAGQVREVDPETGEEYFVQYGYGPGCYGKAQEEVNGKDITQTPEYGEAVNKYWEELQERYEADPRIVALDKEWASCMKKAGYEFTNQNDLWERGYQDIQTRHDEIAGDAINANNDPFEGWSEEEITDFFENTPQDEIEALFNKPFDLTDDQRSQLEALMAEEIDLAVSQFQCSKPITAKTQDLYAEIEEQYALEHEDELRELAATLAGNK